MAGQLTRRFISDGAAICENTIPESSSGTPPNATAISTDDGLTPMMPVGSPSVWLLVLGPRCAKSRNTGASMTSASAD